MNSRGLKILILISFLCCLSELTAKQIVSPDTTKILNIRIWPSPDSTRVVFDLSHAPVFAIKKTDDTHVCLEINKAQLTLDPNSLMLANTRIKSIKTIEKSGKLEIEFSLERNLKPNVFTLAPNQKYGDRLVLDFEMDQSERDAILALFEADAPEQSTSPSITKSPNPENNQPTVTPSVALQPVKTLTNKKHHFIVAIDPGHGGEDPGAIGKRGTREKDVVLAISRHLKAMIDKEPNMRAVLIRNGDYYIALHERVSRARKHHADLFVSIHADAFHDRRADGASVFTLSERGASSAAARWLAVRENKSDLIGGVKLSDKNKMLASVLLDLSQTKSKEEGFKAARYVLTSLGKVGSLHGGRVEQAGFAVLKAPDIPSLLVETGFISNSSGEAKLRHNEHQKKIARAILEGIRRYASERHH